MRTIGLVTSARSDLGIYLPVMRAISRGPDLDLKVIVTGMHLSPEFGLTARHVEGAGFEIDARVDSMVASDTPSGLAKSMGLGVSGFAQLFSDRRPDILLVLGDRFDMYPAAVAALPFRIPVAHLAGGEATEGLIDESIRHSITKLSHIHFVSTAEYRDRVVQMGEEPWRVTLTGMPSLDNLRELTLPNEDQVRREFGLAADKPTAVVTFHPVTLQHEHTGDHIMGLLSALRSADFQCLFTYPNADTAGRIIIEKIEMACQERSDWKVVKNAGQENYYGLLQVADVMVGNSSSGIIESASFGLPAINIGIRQRGRVQARNVIDCAHDQHAIGSALGKSVSQEFRASLEGLKNPYGDGWSADRIVSRLVEVQLNDSLIVKRFHRLSPN